MTIAEYLNKHDMSLTAFAQKLGRPVSTVHGWMTGRRIPSLRDIPAIENATNGAVTAEAFILRPAKRKRK